MEAAAVLSVNGFAGLAAAVADPSRAAMLMALMDGTAFSAGELARSAGITPQTASTHLARLKETGLVAEVRQGRHRYFALASPEIAALMETLMTVSAGAVSRAVARGPRDLALRRARVCYDHLAGRAGVAVAGVMADWGVVALDGFEARLTEGAPAILQARLGLAFPEQPEARRSACRACLDWSERRPHLAGRLGEAILTLALQRCWLERTEGSRALKAGPAGRRALKDALGLEWVDL